MVEEMGKCHRGFSDEKWIHCMSHAMNRAVGDLLDKLNISPRHSMEALFKAVQQGSVSVDGDDNRADMGFLKVRLFNKLND